MEISRAKYLAEALINSKLSREDLEDLLVGMHDDEIVKVYSEVLEDYFCSLLKQQEENDSWAKNKAKIYSYNGSRKLKTGQAEIDFCLPLF